MATTASQTSSNAPEHVQRHVRLLSASVSGNESRVREILAEEQWPSTSDLDTLRQALVKAATKGSLKVLRVLLDSGADVHPKMESELSPLFKAAEAGHLAVVLELLEHDADPNWQSAKTAIAGQTALFRAAEAGHLAVVTTLLGRKADPNLRAKNGQTALYLACLRGHNAVVKALLEGGADPDGGRDGDGRVGDRDGRTPLLFISAEKLPEEKVPEEKKTSKNSTERTFDERLSEKKSAAKKKAAEKISHWNLDTVMLLLRHGADPNARDATKRSPLHWAATNGYVELARCLLSGEIRNITKIDAKQNRTETALHLASENNRVEIVELLLSHGASVDAESAGQWTPLINAAEKGHADVVAKLLNAGANVSAELSNHMTALHWASYNGHEEVVRLLLERPDINLTRKDHFERTPMICAAEGHHNSLVRMLSPARHAHRLSESAQETTKRFKATIVEFGEFQFEKFQTLEKQKKSSEEKLRTQLDERTRRKEEEKLRKAMAELEKKPPKQLVFNPTVYELLYGFDENTGQPSIPVIPKHIKYQPDFRWIHLPSNNIAWIEILLARFFIESGHRDVEGFKALGKCFDQEHRGPLAHANFMRPYCHRVPSRRAEREDSSLDSVAELVDEQNAQLDQATLVGSESVVTDVSENSTGKPTETKKKSRSEQIAERHPQRQKRHKGPPGNPPGTKGAKLNSRQSSFAPSLASSEAFRQLVNNGKMVVFMPFLHYETDKGRVSMADTIQKARNGVRAPDNASRDELLVHAYMRGSLHPRRTLDQFFYHGIDTSQRDSDQVVWRYCHNYRASEEPKLFMVDQLWMWVLGGDTVITCFPQRWNQPEHDPLDVVANIIKETNAKTQSRVKSVYELAMIITNRCAGIFDRHRLDAQQFQFFDMFEFSIGNVTNEESKLFSKFNKASEQSTQWLSRHHRGSGDDQLEPTNDLLNIHQETKLLAEIKDIQDELKILGNVLYLQSAVMEKFKHNIDQEMRIEGNRKIVESILNDVKRHSQEQLDEIAVHRVDIDHMFDQASDVKDSLTNLLDLKQKHSNALEARFAREQAIIAAKQGQTIMVFTIVTIIFLPMSFIAAFFAINFEEWGDGLTIGYVSKYMFGIGLAISFVFISSAILVHDISEAWKSMVKGSKKYITRLLHNTIPYNEKKDRPDGGASSSAWRPPLGEDHYKPDTSGGASITYRSVVAQDVD
ncbi:unnamed protein product [Discula destructiva]